MALLSKYVEQLSHFYYSNKFSNNNNNNKLLPKQIGHAVIGTAVILYTFKLTYPLIFKSQQQQQPPEQQQHDNDDVDELTTTNINLDELKALEAEKLLQQQKQQQTSLSSSLTSDEPALNGLFIRNLLKLLRIMIPRSICHETGLLAVHSLCLISRTFLSIYVAALEGELVKYIVRKDVRQFRWVLIKWFGIAVPATFINSMIRFLESKLALAFRTRLVRHSYRLYFKNQNYYRVSNLDGRIENADHRLTEDISVFTSSIAHLYGSLTKPIFDLMLIGLTLMRSSRQLRANIFFGPALAVTVISLTGHIMRIASPKFGQLVSEEANRYAYLRHIHSRIITNAEEIAFYGGHKVELNQLSQAYNRLVTQMNVIFKQKLWFIMLEQFFMKYVWSGTGMIMVSLPILTTTTIKTTTTTTTTTNSNDVISERTRYLTTARNLLISAADAIERLMSSYKEIVTLAGYTFRVAGMLQVFEETANGNYIRDNFVQLNNNNNNNNKHHLIEIYDGRPLAKGSVIYAQNPQDMRIELHNVPVVTPNCDVVVPSLTLELAPGMHLLITGPNGCGKSSLFRILSGLWPIYAGELRVPQPIEGKPCMFYIPQRPYMSIGSLCDQIIYPDTQLDMERKNVTKADLMTILKMVSLEHIAQRDSFELVRDWKDILSGGEKQRMAIARLFYHKPKYALLDECTSAVSIDVENSIYENAKNMGITLLTITHRPSLWKFHTHVLEFDGLGGWKFRTMEMATHEQQQQI